ncbi:MAG: hypothetical protein II912_04720 [Clostridia bacterium]|jgi:hypothetical protein|nr:hypothetical protein [Clostridia bacterium]MBR5751961.1 hypothetical protein [Clostridia bacterium]
MLSISDQTICLNRGDDASFQVTLTDEDGNPYAMESGDALSLTVRALPDEDSPVVLFTRSITNTIVLTAADTQGLEVGRYSAAIRLCRGDGRSVIVYPALKTHGRKKAWNNFIIDPEVDVNEP